MGSAVKPCPNHYDTLGLEPTASSDEIARAFAREISVFRPRTLDGITQISLAYETLRDPIKRQAYDASLGFAPKPVAKHVRTAENKQVVDVAPSASAKPRAATGLPSWAPERNGQPRTQEASEPTLGSFIAQSLREPVNPTAALGGQRQQERAPQGKAKPIPESPIPDFLAVARELGASSAVETGGRPIEWKRVGWAAGGLVPAVGLLGALSNLSGGNTEDSPQAEPDVTVTLPVAKPPPNRTVPSPARDAVEVPPDAPLSAIAPPPEVESAAAPQQPALAEGQPAESSPSAESRTAENLAEGATAAAAVKPPPVQGVAAGMPLPNSVIARTIERIGYACGEVASTTAAATPGIYKVTCTSGQSYQATPVRGRYRFRRWGSR